MSAEATGWVFRHSPARGVTFTVHLAVADSVNDQNENEFWMSQINLAKKARCTRASAQAAIGHLIRAGLLTLLEDNSKAGKPNRYRFEVPSGLTGGAQPVGTQVPSDKAQTQRTTQENPISSRAAVDQSFNAFWEKYPKKTAKRSALTAFERAVKRATAIDALHDQGHAIWKINDAAARYARAMTGKDPQYIKNPTTWLNGDCWEDEGYIGGPLGRAMTQEEEIEADRQKLLREYNSVKEF